MTFCRLDRQEAGRLMGFELRVLSGSLCYHTETLEEFERMLILFGVRLPTGDKVALICEACGHSTVGSRHRTYDAP